MPLFQGNTLYHQNHPQSLLSQMWNFQVLQGNYAILLLSNVGSKNRLMFPSSENIKFLHQAVFTYIRMQIDNNIILSHYLYH